MTCQKLKAFCNRKKVLATSSSSFKTRSQEEQKTEKDRGESLQCSRLDQNFSLTKLARMTNADTSRESRTPCQLVLNGNLYIYIGGRPKLGHKPRSHILNTSEPVTDQILWRRTFIPHFFVGVRSLVVLLVVNVGVHIHPLLLSLQQ